MSADRELLELAAKAAGIDLTGGHGEAGGALFLFYRDRADGPPFSWAPLHDDGDALRLAVKLGIEVRDSYQYDRACAYLRVPGLEFWELNNSDPYAATRRAIVRAAAAIGSQQ